MSRYGRLGKNIAFITIGNFTSKILSFLMVPFYTAIFSTDEFGVVDLMSTTLNLIMPFLTLLVSEALLRFALDKEKNQSAVFTTGMALFLAGCSVFLALSPLMFLFETFRGYYVLFVLYYLSTVLHTALAFFTRGIEKVAVYSACGVIQTVIMLSLNIVFLSVIDLGVEGYLCAMIIASLVSSACLFFGAKLYRYIQPKTFSKPLMGEMLRYSAPLIPNALSWWISSSSNKYLLTAICGTGVVGVYAASQRIPTLFATVTTIFMGAWNISSVEDFGSEESKRFFSNVYRIYSSFSIIVVAGIICLTKFIAGILFANEFFEGWRYVPFLTIGSLFHSMSGFLGSVYTASRKTKMVFVSSTVAAAINIALNAALIPFFGGHGAAVATLMSYFAIWLVRLIHSRTILVVEWNKFTDITSYVLLILQAILLLAEMPIISTVGVWVILAVVVAINGKQMLPLVAKILKRK